MSCSEPWPAHQGTADSLLVFCSLQQQQHMLELPASMKAGGSGEKLPMGAWGFWQSAGPTWSPLRAGASLSCPAGSGSCFTALSACCPRGATADTQHFMCFPLKTGDCLVGEVSTRRGCEKKINYLSRWWSCWVACSSTPFSILLHKIWVAGTWVWPAAVEQCASSTSSSHHS